MNALLKDIFREIKRTPGRFLSLLIMTALGASSVVGIQAASIDMRAVADKTYKAHNLYDLQIKSPTGFDDSDIAALAGAPGVAGVTPTYVYDVYAEIENENRALRAYAVTDDINNIGLLEGRLPENPGECAVERRLLDDGNIGVGDEIRLSLDNAAVYNYIFANGAFTVVGVVDSPLYISFERGATTLGDGSLKYYLYLHPDAFRLSVFTDVYMLMDGSRDMDNLSDDYYAAADNFKRQIERAVSRQAPENPDGAPGPEWFYFTRKDGLAFDSYYQDTLRLQRIGYVFPLVFFFVAVLVALTSMSRMVSEHRTQIGVYKALGYRPAAIAAKYLIYAFSASVTGGCLGVILGSRLFPFIIADAYGHIYDMPPVDMPIPMSIAALAVVSAVLSVALTTLWTCLKSTNETPALLMRPKPPARGKRVLLERAPFIWNRLGFFSKVAARNIFRYKRRFIMTLAGVAGCAALLTTAFGLRDSVGGVGVLQYGHIVKYDSRAYLKDIAGEQRLKLDAALPGAHLYIKEESVTAAGPGGNLPASLVVPEIPEDLSKFIDLNAPETGEPVDMNDRGVLVTDKLARVMGVTTGGAFTVTCGDGRSYTAEITGVVDNYILHCIYMSPGVYREIFGDEPRPNGVWMIHGDGREFAVVLLENSDVRAVVFNADVEARVGEQSDALGVVTVVLIVLACALALVVLFNLTNINIAERVRELATIRVLGFYDAELALYIYRENGAVTLLGVILGLIGGYFLHGYVITTVEIDILKFPKLIYPQSYAVSVALSLLFAVFVNLVTSRKLAKIDMVESLKNIE